MLWAYVLEVNGTEDDRRNDGLFQIVKELEYNPCIGDVSDVWDFGRLFSEYNPCIGDVSIFPLVK